MSQTTLARIDELITAKGAAIAQAEGEVRNYNSERARMVVDATLDGTKAPSKRLDEVDSLIAEAKARLVHLRGEVAELQRRRGGSEISERRARMQCARAERIAIERELRAMLQEAEAHDVKGRVLAEKIAMLRNKFDLSGPSAADINAERLINANGVSSPRSTE